MAMFLFMYEHSFAEFELVDQKLDIELEREAKELIKKLGAFENEQLTIIPEIQQNTLLNRYHSVEGLNGVKLYVLISSSMPDSMVSSYISESVNYNAHLVLNGLIENDFYKTAKYFLRMNKKEGGFAIDSRIFDQYNVTNVPAIVLSRDDGEYDIVNGAVSIRHALNEISKKGGLAYEASTLLSR